MWNWAAKIVKILNQPAELGMEAAGSKSQIAPRLRIVLPCKANHFNNTMKGYLLECCTINLGN